MWRFFRNVRRHLIPGRRFTRYLLYAIGEIVLVVIGILIALQINNWNQKRQKEIIFDNSLQQLYNSIKIDTEYLRHGIEYTEDQIVLIDRLLADPSQFPGDLLPGILFYLDQEFDLGIHNRETGALIATLDYDPSDTRQREIAKELTTYASFHSSYIFSPRMQLTTLLENQHIPNPMLAFGYSAFENFAPPFTNFYSDEDVAKARLLAASKEVRSILIGLRALKLSWVEVYTGFFEDGISVLKMMKTYNPDLKLLYKEVGIIGSALPDGWEKSVPMKLMDAEKSIWEVEVYLTKGAVKFRTRDSWSTNWGGKTFPKGNTIYFGDNIDINREGKYRVRLNLSENTYEFLRILE